MLQSNHKSSSTLPTWTCNTSLPDFPSFNPISPYLAVPYPPHFNSQHLTWPYFPLSLLTSSHPSIPSPTHFSPSHHTIPYLNDYLTSPHLTFFHHFMLPHPVSVLSTSESLEGLVGGPSFVELVGPSLVNVFFGNLPDPWDFLIFSK